MTDRQEMAEIDAARVTAPRTYDPIQAQKDLQRLIMARMEEEYPDYELPITDTAIDSLDDLTTLVAANITAIQVELAELLDWLPWKWWKNYGDLTVVPDDAKVTEMKYEVVDIAHFLFNICIALGMNWQEFLDIYATKQAENRARQARGY